MRAISADGFSELCNCLKALNLLLLPLLRWSMEFVATCCIFLGAISDFSFSDCYSNHCDLFSFFGTFSVIERMEPIHETVVVAADGSEIRRSEIEDMVAFLNTDEELFFGSGGQAGGNYLNERGYCTRFSCDGNGRYSGR